MGNNLFTGCVSVLVPDNIVILLLRLSRSESSSGQAEVFPRCWLSHPWRVPQLVEWPPAGFAATTSGEAEKSPEAELSVGRGGDLRPRSNSASGEAEFCARGSAASPVVLDVPSGDGRRHVCTVAGA